MGVFVYYCSTYYKAVRGGGGGGVERGGHVLLLISGPFFKILLHNHFITDFFFKKTGEAKDSAIFPFFILLHKRAKPILPPYLHPNLRARTQTLYSPLTLTLSPPMAPQI